MSKSFGISASEMVSFASARPVFISYIPDILLSLRINSLKLSTLSLISTFPSVSPIYLEFIVVFEGFRSILPDRLEKGPFTFREASFTYKFTSGFIVL